MNTLLTKLTTRPCRRRVRLATAAEVLRTFSTYRDQLQALAAFLTADEDLANSCLVDACALVTTQNGVFEEWLERWARRATIRCAVQRQHARIIELAASYDRKPCTHDKHPELPADLVTRLYACRTEIAGRLDVMCRLALVVCGIENYTMDDSSLLLGVTKTSLRAAYCAGLNALTIMRSQLPVAVTTQHYEQIAAARGYLSDAYDVLDMIESTF